uniref:Uncharacterized protein n=1 Tax=Siphoviridae sp. ct2wG4 TaxID=2826278 RepID=A0A8S5QWA3_9CAUD|nr:MAG TPA: hypothetical protein [Siphoviridae sp. ct2wG4]DAU49703.1 MAG TPA: hypothetical protein [Caudoviricetes sp.]
MFISGIIIVIFYVLVFYFILCDNFTMQIYHIKQI